jgi:hypothetical protein
VSSAARQRRRARHGQHGGGTSGVRPCGGDVVVGWGGGGSRAGMRWHSQVRGGRRV